jgi:NAD+ kinase
MMQAKVMRDGHCVFSATAMNDVVVKPWRDIRHGRALWVEIDGRRPTSGPTGWIITAHRFNRPCAFSRRPAAASSIGGWVLSLLRRITVQPPIVLSDTGEVAIELAVAGRDASASLTCSRWPALLHGDRIIVCSDRSRMRFCIPRVELL